jgi:voltage-gated potassium channel
LLIQRLEGIGSKNEKKQGALSRRASGIGRNALDGRIKEMVNLYEYNAKRQALGEYLPNLMLHPEGVLKIIWDIAMLFLVVFFAVIVPYRIGFDIELDGPEADFDFAADILFILDIILSFRTAFKVDGVLITDWKAIAHDYATTWLAVDVMASFPIGWFVPSDGGADKINKLFRMLRLVKLFRILRLLKLFPRVMMIIEGSIKLNPSILRFLRSFVAMFMLWHFIGCAYYFIVREELGGEVDCTASDGSIHTCYVNHCLCGTTDPEDFQILEETDINWYNADHRDQWVPHPEVADWDYSRKYWTSMFWAVEVTTGVGDDIAPKSNMEIGFTVFMAVIGLMMYSIVIGSASSALQNMDTAATERRQTLDRITQYMRARKVPAFFQKIIKDFYNHMWSNPTATDEAFNELPPNLRSKLTVVVNRDLVDRIPLLRTLPADVYIRAVENFTHTTFLPGEYMIRQGEIGDDLFLIKRGKVDGVLPNGVTVFSTYTPGDYVGEHALLTGNRRDASYRAVDFVDCLVMSRSQFKELSEQASAFISEVKMTDMIRQKARLQAELDYMQENGLERLYEPHPDDLPLTKPTKIASGINLLKQASSIAMGFIQKHSSAVIAPDAQVVVSPQPIRKRAASAGTIKRLLEGGKYSQRSLTSPAAPTRQNGSAFPPHDGRWVITPDAAEGGETQVMHHNPTISRVLEQPIHVDDLSSDSDSVCGTILNIKTGSQVFQPHTIRSRSNAPQPVQEEHPLPIMCLDSKRIHSETAQQASRPNPLDLDDTSHRALVIHSRQNNPTGCSSRSDTSQLSFDSVESCTEQCEGSKTRSIFPTQCASGPGALAQLCTFGAPKNLRRSAMMSPLEINKKQTAAFGKFGMKGPQRPAALPTVSRQPPADGVTDVQAGETFQVTSAASSTQAASAGNLRDPRGF